MSLLLKAVVPCFLCAMALKRPHSSCAYEDELRELMTYQCPFTGENRCPPFKNESVPMIQSCTKDFWSDMTPLQLRLQHNWFIIIIIYIYKWGSILLKITCQFIHHVHGDIWFFLIRKSQKKMNTHHDMCRSLSMSTVVPEAKPSMVSCPYVHFCFTFSRCMHAWLISMFFGPTHIVDRVMSFDIRTSQWTVRLQLPLLADLVIPMGFHIRKLCTAQLSLVKTWTSNISCLWAMGFAFLICPFARGKKPQLGLFFKGVFHKSILSETEWVESCACSKWVWHPIQ